MSDWKTEYKKAMLRYLLMNGSPVSRESRSYGWIASDWEAQRAAVNNALDGPSFNYDAVRLEETQYKDFDSFDGGETHHCVDAIIEIEGERYRLRYDGSLSSILLGLLNEE